MSSSANQSPKKTKEATPSKSKKQSDKDDENVEETT